ncbi:hypothetical protein MNBD_GAMMA09-77 [hydrothermal vent metagenome]|uniref:Uncharacterized protein n=1 Tax=hydrothermal vent metagenome TaxID=652676 RepID=A0A3B0XRV8_9ZZZZ
MNSDNIQGDLKMHGAQFLKTFLPGIILLPGSLILASCGGGGGGAPAATPPPIQTPPVVSSFARYLDINNNGVNDINDQIIVPFDQAVAITSVSSNDFSLPVTGDTFGSGATVISGPAVNEVTIILGSSPRIKTAQDFSASQTATGSSTGIDVAATLPSGAITSVSGVDAKFSAPVDLIPAFVDSLQSLGNNNSLSVVLGDVDGDQDLDLVVANDGDQANRVYINNLNNNGPGVFTDSGQSLGANDSRSVVLGDVDGDTYLDIVVANYIEGNQVYLNDAKGSGNFSAFGSGIGKAASTSIALGDVDGDVGLNRKKDLDLVVANLSQGNQVFNNNGQGVFTDDTQQFLGLNITLSVVLGDVDGDQYLDMVVANANKKGNLIYINNGNGFFTDSGQLLGVGKSSLDVALGDIDGDTDLDIVVVNSGEGNRVHLNNGSGVFTDAGQSLGENVSFSVALGDIDNDGDLDMVVANGANQGDRIYINDGSGAFTDSGQSLGNDNDYSIALGDIDGDGDLDIVVANYDGANKVYLNSLTAPP